MRALVLALLLTGCAAQTAWRTGATLAAQGHPYAAALQYLDALDRRPGYEMAAESLTIIREDAYREKLAEARAAEARGDWSSAVATYGEIGALLTRFEAHGEIDFPVVDVAARVAATENQAAEEQVTRALAAEAANDWAAAVTAWRAAQGFVPGFRDTELRTHAALFHWGEADQAAGQWRAAADHFVEAGAGTWGDGNRRGASILAALGNVAVWSGNCRQATRDLRAARDLVGGALVADDLADAERCASTTAVVLPFENPSGLAPAGIVLAEAAADATAVAIGARHSEFVHLLERGVTEQIKAEQAITTARTGAPGSLARAHFLIVGKFTQVKVVSTPVTVTPVTIAAKVPGTCKATRSDGTLTSESCLVDTEVRYADHLGRREVRLAGTLRVVRSQGGEQAAITPFDVKRTAEVHWADGFAGANGKPVRIVDLTTVGGDDPRVPASVLALKNASHAFPEEDELIGQALEDVATAAAKAALTVLDAEPAVVDPKTLEIVEL